jgi:hypothetical protein
MVIYCITNLINGKKYIGSDSNNNPNYLGSGTHIKKAIKKYGRENFTKTIINTVTDLDIMKELEEYWIEYFNAYESPMFYNATKYAAGITKFPKHKISNIIKANTGNTYHTGYKQSSYQKNQTSKANLGNNYKCKPVLCYDLNGNFLKEYSSAYNANILLNFKKRDVGICLNANGKQKSSHGFIWKYKNK